MVRQRAKLKWGKEGDANSKLFHAACKLRERWNRIQGLNIKALSTLSDQVRNLIETSQRSSSHKENSRKTNAEAQASNQSNRKQNLIIHSLNIDNKSGLSSKNLISGEMREIQLAICSRFPKQLQRQKEIKNRFTLLKQSDDKNHRQNFSTDKRKNHDNNEWLEQSAHKKPYTH
ncbi:hypothetical protein OSB04_011188 [Centaurea solstitialis]|uniref:Uncharacterized protein n=1 Tax=Centaurea solstitialis TaxID=347529 RepID=A0AA38T8Z1_9ASTR|nr:hypothetical protein OSB04_011188 [Centaurea solstitialis]